MQELSLVDSLRYLGNFCFAISRIKVLKIGKNLEEIGHCICGANNVLEKIIVDENNPYFANDMFFNLYSKNFSTLYQVTASVEHYTTPQTVKIIKRQAFDGIPIKSITITQDCQIEWGAFHLTSNLESITFCGSFQCNDIIFEAATSLKIIRYYSHKPVYSSLFYNMQTNNIVVYCCRKFNGLFSGINPIKSFECINIPIKSCVASYYYHPYQFFFLFSIIL